MLLMQTKGRSAVMSALFVFWLGFAGDRGAWQSEALARQSQRAKELMAAGRFEEAIPIYRQVNQAFPWNPGLLLNLALAEHMAGHERESIPHFEAVLRTQPGLMPALISLGAARLALNQPEQAIAPLQKVLAADSKNNDARGMLAAALLGAGHADQAADQYRKLTEVTPNDPRAWYGLGKSYESIAAATFDRLQKTSAQSPFVAALVADTRVQKRQHRAALILYREALKQSPPPRCVHAATPEISRKTTTQD